MIRGEPLRRALQRRSRVKHALSLISIGEAIYLCAFGTVLGVIIFLLTIGFLS